MDWNEFQAGREGFISNPYGYQDRKPDVTIPTPDANGWLPIESAPRDGQRLAFPTMRYSREGWFWAMHWYAGFIDWVTKRPMPDRQGRIGLQKLWVGPYPTFGEAQRAAAAAPAQ